MSAAKPIAMVHPYDFDLVCPHLGCGLRWDAADKQFKCPCHGSVFDITGKVVGGTGAAAARCVAVESRKRGAVRDLQGVQVGRGSSSRTLAIRVPLTKRVAMMLRLHEWLDSRLKLTPI